MNQYLNAGGKATVKVLFATIAYTGSAWEVVPTIDSAELVSANLVWSTDRLTVALSGYAFPPVVLATQAAAAVPYVVQAEATSATNVDVQFLDMAGVLVTVEDTSMRCNIVVIGA